jgi:hypothetical protein
MKKSYLTPVLAGVLAVTVVGSGAAYYFEFVKDGEPDTDSGKSGGGKSTALTVDQAAESIEAQLDKAQQIAKGELEGGYKAQIKYSAPSGGEIGDVSMTMEAKQKDKMSAVDYSLGYNSDTLLSANVVYDNENETAYVKIPELSEAYLTGTADDINALLEESAESVYYGTAYTDSMAVTSSALSIDEIEDIDFEALFSDLSGYADTIKENAPAATDGENRKVEVDGASCELTTKVYTVTGSDVVKILNAVAEKGRTDETLKSTLTSLGMTEDDYNEMWDELTDVDDEESDDEAVFDVYYLGENVAGWAVSADDEEYYMISAQTDSNVIVDWNIVSDGEGLTAKGAVDVDGDTLNGTVKAEILSQSYDVDYNTFTETSTVEISYNALTVTDDSVVGEVVYTISAEDDNAVVTVDFNNAGDDFDTSFSITENGEDMGKVSVTMQQTDASDITVPSGTMYKMTDETELETYLGNCDIEGWEAKVQAALGDELYNEFFGSADDDDYTYDDDFDYDWDDYDWDQYDSETDI